jgi:hypothetical protein
MVVSAAPPPLPAMPPSDISTLQKSRHLYFVATPGVDFLFSSRL